MHFARAELNRLHGLGRGHLVQELEREIRLVERLERELKSHPVGTQLEQTRVHQIEEQLLQHENNLAEHVRRIEAIDDTLPHERTVLLQRAEELLNRAKADLQRHRDGGRGHLVAEIEHEVTRIEELVNELRAHPNAQVEAAHARQIQQRLVEHERRLAQELRRIEGH
jgi:DNA gyrase/topoisomerase IV subunit A